MGGKSKGGGESQMARMEEQQRQQRIREGTQRINSIFDGGARTATGAIGADAAYDPNATYYTSTGDVWTPASGLLMGEQAGAYAKLMGNDQAASMFAAGVPGFAMAASPEEQYRRMVQNGGLFSGVSTASGFGDDFFNQRQQAYLDYASPQLEQQYADAQKQLTYSLARSGNMDSSARGQQVSELQKKYDIQKQQIADKALAFSTDARNNIESARSDLIATLNATGDAEGAANSAIARSQALSQPDAFSPLGQLFGDFTNALGVQAAQERAAAASGGSYQSRYNTGLFGNTGASTVKK